LSGICLLPLEPGYFFAAFASCRFEFPLTYAQLFSVMHTNYTARLSFCLRRVHRSNSVNRNEAQATRIRFRGDAGEPRGQSGRAVPAVRPMLSSSRLMRWPRSWPPRTRAADHANLSSVCVLYGHRVGPLARNAPLPVPGNKAHSEFEVASGSSGSSRCVKKADARIHRCRGRA